MIFCSDRDECFSSPCSHICENSVGSFSCKCADGYRLRDDGRSCIAADGEFQLRVCINSNYLASSEMDISFGD